MTTPPADLPFFYRFADLVLDPSERRVLRDGRPIELNTLSFDLLRFLVESAPAVVTPDALAEHVWGRHFVSPENLAQRVMLLRHSLEDDASRPRYVETVRNKGYRLVPVVERVERPAGRAPRGRAFITAAGVLVIAAVLILGFWRGSSDHEEVTAADAALNSGGQSVPPIAARASSFSVAVLPFETPGASVEDSEFAAGLHDQLHNQLTKIRGLTVTSRSSVLRYAETRPSISEIAAELNVAAVMESTLRFAGEQLMVTAQLVDVATDSTLWSETLRADRRNVEDIFDIQNDIATSIATALGAQITAEDLERIERQPTESAAAYARYLSAVAHDGNVRFADALRELDLAVELDSDFAEAYAQRAILYAYAQITTSMRGQLLRAGRSADGFEALALENASRALELDPDLGLGWAARALTQQFRFRFASAGEAFGRAIALGPNDARVLREYARFHHYLGNLPEAMSLIRQAARLDPNGALTLNYLAVIALGAGLTEEAAAALDRALALDLSYPGNYLFAGLVSSDPVAAARWVRIAEALITEQYQGFMLIGLARGYRRLGLEQDAARSLYGYGRWVSAEYSGAGDRAAYHLMRGDMDEAHEWLRIAVERLERGETDAGFLALTTLIADRRTDPALAEERFQKLLNRLVLLQRAN